MRRFLTAFACLTALALPAAASAGDRSDGALSVKNATGTVSIVGRGAVLGHCARCTVVVGDPNPADGEAPVVVGWEESHQLSATRTSWSGDGIRFKLVGGFFRVKIVGNGIDVGAVVTGQAVLDGQGASAGIFALDDGPFTGMPGLRTVVQLGS